MKTTFSKIHLKKQLLQLTQIPTVHLLPCFEFDAIRGPYLLLYYDGPTYKRDTETLMSNILFM